MTRWAPSRAYPTRVARDAALVRFWHRGVPAQRIAARLGLSRQQVYHLARLKALPRRRLNRDSPPPGECSTPGCPKPAYAMGLCRTEYQRSKRLEVLRKSLPLAGFEGDPLAHVRHLAEPLPPRAKTPYEIAYGHPPGGAPE
jgi:hypothetical protein